MKNSVVLFCGCTWVIQILGTTDFNDSKMQDKSLLKKKKLIKFSIKVPLSLHNSPPTFPPSPLI